MGEEQQQKMQAMAFSKSVITGENTSSSAGDEEAFFRARSNNDSPSVANSCSNSSSQSSSKIQEHDYIGLTAGDSSSIISVNQQDSQQAQQDQVMISMAGGEVPDLNLGLRLGPPKKQDAQSEQLLRVKLGSKRGYSETVDASDLVKGMNSKLLPAMFPWSSNSSKAPTRGIEQQRSSFTPFQRKVEPVNQFSCLNTSEDTPTSSGPMVGWPPVQSFRKNTLVAPQQTAKISAEAEPQQHQQHQQQQQQQVVAQACSLFVKVYMDGVPIGRKVDLDANNSYPKLSTALKEMFSGFVSGQSIPNQRSGLSSGELHNLFDGYDAEYVLTYEDKDGDLMLVGDVPWRMFAATVKRLRIMKGSDAIGLSVPKDFEDATRTKAAAS